jgi:hypothetical protein
MNDMFIRERSQLKGSEDENGEWIYRGKVVEDNTFDIISPPSELAINAQRIVTDSSVSIALSPDTLEMPVSLNDPISTIEDFIPNDHVLIGLSEKPVTPDPSPIGLLEESTSPVLSPVNWTKRKTLPSWLLPKDPKKAAKIIVDKRAEAKEKAQIFYDELVLDEKRIVTRNVAKAREQINQRKDLDVSQKRKFKKRVMSQVMSELNDASKSVLVNGLKVSQSIREYGSEVTNAAIIAEIDNFVNNNVFEPVRDSDLSHAERGLIIGCKLFLTPKICTTTSKLLRLKARICLLGNLEDRDSYDSVSSPAVSCESMLALLAIATKEKHSMICLDQIAAYLQNPMLKGSTCIMKLDPFVSRILTDKYPEYLPYVDASGCFKGRCLKTVYGMLQASLQQFTCMKEVLVGKMGFYQIPKIRVCSHPFDHQENSFDVVYTLMI